MTVRDKHGKIIRDLTKDDFTLQEDGRPQTIKYFSQETNLPLTLGLLVDTSRSQTGVLEAERNASRSFLDQMLVQPKDKAFLIHFDREVELLQDLTSSREKLQAALELLKTPSDRRALERSQRLRRFALWLGVAPWRRHAALRRCLSGVERIDEEAAGPESDHHSLGRRRPRQQDLSGKRNRVRAACRHGRLLHLFCGATPRRRNDMTATGAAAAWAVEAAEAGPGAVAVGPVVEADTRAAEVQAVRRRRASIRGTTRRRQENS